MAENRRINDLLSIFDYGIVRLIDTNPPDYAQYGLDQPKIELGIKIKGNPKFRTLLIGSNNPNNTSCYARVEGQPEVLLIGISYKRELDREPSFFIKQMTNNNE